MLTAFDVGIGLLVFISAILATARGLTREVLSLGTWAGSALFAIWMWQAHPEFAEQYIADKTVSSVATVLVSFIVSLIVLHLITIRIADFVVDSKIGPLDRTLGFVFGGLRGVLIGVVFAIFIQFLGSSVPAEWVSESRTLPALSSLGDSLIEALPGDLESQVNDILQRDNSGGGGAETPVDATQGTQLDSTNEQVDGTDAGEDSSVIPT